MNWYQISNKAEEDFADIYLFSEIGGMDITAKTFVEDINNIKSKKLNVYINSLGGSVFDGIAIYNTLKNFKGKVTTKIQGIGASIASVIALAGDKIEMSDNSLLMIHDPYAVAGGNSTEMRKTADLLDKIRNEIANIYQKQTGLDTKTIESLMTNETWFNSSEALEKGFITDISEEVEVKNEYDLSNFKNITTEKVSSILNNKKMAKENIINEEVSNKETNKTEQGLISKIKSLLVGEPTNEHIPGHEETAEEERREEGEADVQDWEGMEKRIKNLEDAVADIKKEIGVSGDEESEEVRGSAETANNEVEDLQNKVKELEEQLEISSAKNSAKKVDAVADKDPVPQAGDVIADPNQAFFNKMAKMVKNI
tara:strand:+ start:466 stop:1572 length:1107 start_codon:yes stop_codon:yes gene_type:complete